MTPRRTALARTGTVVALSLVLGGYSTGAQAKERPEGQIVFAGETDAGSQLWTVRPEGTGTSSKARGGWQPGEAGGRRLLPGLVAHRSDDGLRGTS